MLRRESAASSKNDKIPVLRHPSFWNFNELSQGKKKAGILSAAALILGSIMECINAFDSKPNGVPN
ncbi:MAG: hypothetical protein OXI87_22165 [Albidovulum sp.]|nr:hypothetical protein [Albidovulum sp.]